MASMLKPSFFNTTNNTVKTMMSIVVSATLPKTTNTQLPRPVNFTLEHIEEIDPSGTLSCVYWNNTVWVEDGCSLLQTNSSHSVCSCVHLSTFALIMQTNPDQASDDSDPLLELLNTVAVAVGLFFLSLSLLTFALCRRNMRVNLAPLINLCISLFLAHLLFLLTQTFLQYIQTNQLLCAAMAGVLHFLFLSAFVWMFFEAVLLLISVKNLTKIRSKQKEVLGWKCLIVIGYVIPLIVVGVSVGLFPDGYGSKQCWIKTDRDFVWSFLGPVCFIIIFNLIFFIMIIITLRKNVAGLNSEFSQIKQMRILVFKTLVQIVILGCPWILGFFVNGSRVLEIVFLFLNSQQGTFIFLVHCIFNQEGESDSISQNTLGDHVTEMPTHAKLESEKDSNTHKSLKAHCTLGYQPPLAPWTATPSDFPAVDDWMKCTEEVWEQTHCNIEEALQCAKQQADRRRGRPHPFILSFGDQVWLSTQDLRFGVVPVVPGPLND
ncbi:adhesion G protein-coupled receptor E3-like [Colossoma macropomum]|uniref:adhesion G protein-coupled receptor E3-like n=1 Tax=Colossoma macropomum TaxID=42526 RepID=UPI00186565D2|nr:adhesion G protein-coupled receptor E3-like [Colossoma macropomum]